MHSDSPNPADPHAWEPYLGAKLDGKLLGQFDLHD